MCMITWLKCYGCFDYSNTLFLPCEHIKKNKHYNADPDASLLPHGTRMFCPDLRWPAANYNNDEYSEHLCDKCLEYGVFWYLDTVEEERRNEEYLKRKYGPAVFRQRHLAVDKAKNGQVPSPPGRKSAKSKAERPVRGACAMTQVSETHETAITILDGTSTEEEIEKSETEDESDESVETIKESDLSKEIEVNKPGLFPPDWGHIPKSIKQWVVSSHCQVSKNESFLYWGIRKREAPHRQLTLWIPSCKICKLPSFDEDGGIAGVEMEFSSMLWASICRLAKDEEFVQTDLHSGFITKPCTRCVNRELELRHYIVKSLQKEGNGINWAIWIWLNQRSSGAVSFWNHECLNFGVPDDAPPRAEKYMQLMADGWLAKSGTYWEDFVNIDSPAECYSWPMIRHQKPFVSLSQWNRLVGYRHREQPCPVITQAPGPVLTQDMELLRHARKQNRQGLGPSRRKISVDAQPVQDTSFVSKQAIYPMSDSLDSPPNARRRKRKRDEKTNGSGLGYLTDSSNAVGSHTMNHPPTAGFLYPPTDNFGSLATVSRRIQVLPPPFSFAPAERSKLQSSYDLPIERQFNKVSQSQPVTNGSQSSQGPPAQPKQISFKVVSRNSGEINGESPGATITDRSQTIVGDRVPFDDPCTVEDYVFAEAEHTELGPGFALALADAEDEFMKCDRGCFHLKRSTNPGDAFSLEVIPDAKSRV
ncbi:hypothetical protein F5Y15DRAFT_429467 [Xylariaceae sp. FL0016]|nr:hypothetical protein F5Y15DRAFT_429467 [Xylariaceae sp. FL0016]